MHRIRCRVRATPQQAARPPLARQHDVQHGRVDPEPCAQLDPGRQPDRQRGQLICRGRVPQHAVDHNNHAATPAQRPGKDSTSRLVLAAVLSAALLVGAAPARALVEDPFDVRVRHDLAFVPTQLGRSVTGLPATSYPS